MGKSILVLLILIITLVAAPFFGSFGEALDKPVVSAASTLSEYLFNQLSNSQDHLNQSLTVPQKTAIYYDSLWFTFESDYDKVITKLYPPEIVLRNEFTIESDRGVHTFNPNHIEYVYPIDPMDPIQIGPAIISEPFGYA